LPPLTQVEEMLIARVHCHVEVRMIRGAQFKYKGHVINFLNKTAKIYNVLPLLPSDLEIILLRPAGYKNNERMSRQFRKDYRVRRSVIHVISDENLDGLPVDGFVDDSLIQMDLAADEVTKDTLGDDEVEADEPETAAVP
ncbi:hypothetical protein DM02DRAFT_468628, partial [Periconia macrospinosa]